MTVEFITIADVETGEEKIDFAWDVTDMSEEEFDAFLDKQMERRSS